ncbi:MAG: hypothetical protein ACM37W_09965 [Actinomycetota bacterium]
MRFNLLSIWIGMTGLSLGIFPVPIATALPPTHSFVLAQTGQTGKVGQVSTQGAVRLVVMNQTSVALFAGISGGTRVEVTPQGKSIFVFDSTPINVFVYPAQEPISLKFETSVRANIVTVQVSQINDYPPGDSAINIRPSGDIYVY